MTIFISAIGSGAKALKSYHLTDLDIRPDQRRLLDHLRYDGFEYCMVAPSNSVLTMARGAIENLIEITAVEENEIDAVLFCSDSVSNGEHAPKGLGEVSSREEVLRLFWSEFAFKNAAIWTSGFVACANFTNSIKLAISALEQGRSNILVVLAESRPAVMSRIPSLGGYVYSDMAIAFLVSRDKGQFTVDGVSLEMSAAMFNAFYSNKNLLQGVELVNCVKNLRKATKEWNQPLGTFTPDLVISDNLGSMTLALVERGLGERPISLTTPTKGSIGHAFSMDCALSLMHPDVESRLLGGEQALLLNVGPWAVGALLVRKNTAP